MVKTFKNLASLALVLCCMLAVSGCEVHHEEHGYSMPDASFDWGTVSGRLTGSWHETEGGRVLGAPYDLLIWISVNNAKARSVSVSNLEMYSPDEKRVELEYENIKETPNYSQKEQASYASFTMNKLGLVYDDYVLKFNVEVNLDNKDITEEVTLRFDKNTKEYEVNGVVDALNNVKLF